MSTKKAPKEDAVGRSRRDFLKAGALAVAGMMLPSGCAKISRMISPKTSKRPNIILIFTDDQNADVMGYASDGLVKTPNLDRLAANGTIFRKGYCSAMTCSPARTSLFSGLDYIRAEKGPGPGFVLPLKEGAWTWPHALRAGGYRTGLIGKNHMVPTYANHGFDTLLINQITSHNAPPEYDEKAGGVRLNDYQEFLKAHGTYDYLDGYGFPNFPKDKQAEAKAYRETWAGKGWPLDSKLHRMSWMRDRAVEFIEESKKDKRPYALALTVPSPHAPYVPAREFKALYDPEKMELPTDEWTDMEDMPEALKKAGAAVSADGKKNNACRDNHRPEEIKQELALYRALVSQIDAMVGDIMKSVDIENTLIVFTSDQGDYQGKRGLLGKSPWIPFEELGKVPFFASGWKVPKGRVVDAPVVHVDLAPTFLKAAGVPVPEGLDGIPLQNYFENPDFGKDRTVYCNGYFGGEMVAWENLRYVECGKQSPMLFDLDKDPGEVKNLANKAEWQESLKAMQAKLETIRKRPAPALPHFEKIPPRPTPK